MLELYKITGDLSRFKSDKYDQEELIRFIADRRKVSKETVRKSLEMAIKSGSLKFENGYPRPLTQQERLKRAKDFIKDLRKEKHVI